MDHYLVHTRAGIEREVRDCIAAKFATPAQKKHLAAVRVPATENAGPVFRPGVLLIEMKLTPVTQRLVLETPGVVGFVGGSTATPVPAREVDALMEAMRSVAPPPDVSAGDRVRVLTGPFSGFTGTVREVRGVGEALSVAVDMFGRETVADVPARGVEKA